MKFSEITGHTDAIRYLRKLVDDDRIPHAILISGPPGIGKLRLARTFAQYIHCTDRHNGESCGNCPSCRQHMSLNFPDLLFAYPVVGTKSGKALISDDYFPQWKQFLNDFPLAPYDKWLDLINAENTQPQIKVAESDDIIRKISLSNYLAEKKVMILWLPEKLHPAAANKLLKIIEEPTEGNVFIFVSDSPSDILPTIFSRVQRVNLRPVPQVDVVRHLMKEFGVSSEDAETAAGISAGNLYNAEEFISLKSEENEFRDLFRQLMRMAYIRDVDGLKDWSENMANLKREKSRRFISYAARMIRENYIYNLGDSRLVALSPDDVNFSRNFSPFVNGRNVNKILSELDDADRDIRGNGNAKIIFFDFAIQLIILIKI